jgi:hypothetical protein
LIKNNWSIGESDNWSIGELANWAIGQLIYSSHLEEEKNVFSNTGKS